MKHTKNLLTKLWKREKDNPIGNPITDTDFKKAFREITIYRISIIVSLIMVNIVCILHMLQHFANNG